MIVITKRGNEFPYFPNYRCETVIKEESEPGEVLVINLYCYTRHQDDKGVWRRMMHRVNIVGTSTSMAEVIKTKDDAVEKFIGQVYHYLLFGKVDDTLRSPDYGVMCPKEYMYHVEDIQETEEERLLRLTPLLRSK